MTSAHEFAPPSSDQDRVAVDKIAVFDDDLRINWKGIRLGSRRSV